MITSKQHQTDQHQCTTALAHQTESHRHFEDDVVGRSEQKRFGRILIKTNRDKTDKTRKFAYGRLGTSTTFPEVDEAMSPPVDNYSFDTRRFIIYTCASIPRAGTRKHCLAVLFRKFGKLFVHVQISNIYARPD